VVLTGPEEAVGYAHHQHLGPGNTLRLEQKKLQGSEAYYGYATAKCMLHIFGCVSIDAGLCLLLQSFLKHPRSCSSFTRWGMPTET
jgi:hypothetical protein